PCAPALAGDAGTLGCDLLLGRISKVTHHLPADRRVGVQQPLDDVHSLLPPPGKDSLSRSISPPTLSILLEAGPAQRQRRLLARRARLPTLTNSQPPVLRVRWAQTSRVSIIASRLAAYSHA